MATIGYATLQIIPSLKGVTEAIDKQIEGKVVNVTVEPKVDRRSTDRAGQQAKESVEKHTREVKVDVDQATAKSAGKRAGETVTKEVKDAVRKGDIGKTVGDEVASAATSSGGRQAAKAIVDGIADGVKREMPRGGVGEAIVDGIADGVKEGIDGVGIGGEVVTTIGTGIKSGNLGKTIRDAVVPTITGIGQEIRSSASGWAGNIADALRSGDIQGATTDIGNTVRNTTSLISEIGATFGLQLDGVREFGDTAATTLSDVGGNIQGVINTANEFSTALTGVGTLLETVLPGKASKGVAAMTATFAPLISTIAGLNAAVAMLPKDLQGVAASTIPGISPTFRDQGADKPWYERDITSDAWRWLQNRLKGNSAGGFTGNAPVDQVAGVVHGGEYVINARATAGIEKSMPGLLPFLNRLPGYKGGGKVQLGNISGAGITTAEQQSMWDVVRGAFPNAILTSATRTVMTEGHPDFHNAGRAIDISGPNMGAIASWIASNYPDSLELIHSPFSRNIKNGRNVGDGTGFYGAGLMAAHRDHVHWALGKAATRSAPKTDSSSDMMAVLGPGIAESAPPMTATSAQALPEMATAEATANQSARVSLPGSISGLSAFGLSGLGAGVGETSAGSDLSVFGQAAGAAVSGQVSSALGAFGVSDSPGWLKGISALVGGISVSGGDGASAPVTPLASAPKPATPPAMSSVHGSQAGQQPGPQVVYNVRTATVEDAFLVAQRREKERAAANLARY